MKLPLASNSAATMVTSFRFRSSALRRWISFRSTLASTFSLACSPVFVTWVCISTGRLWISSRENTALSISCLETASSSSACFGALATITGPDLGEIFRGAGATFLRVEFTLVLAGLWTIPVGVYVGLRPRMAAVAQPIAQIAASVPATALFPIVLLALIRVGGGLGIGSIILMLLGTQWYILFNVIAGASAIPTDLKEVCSIFHLSQVERWRRLFLPAIFPFLVTGFITASGGAWNASIVAEYVHFQGKTYST